MGNRNIGIDIKIERIAAEETWPIRHIALWPDKPLNHCVLEKDLDGWHFGAFYKGSLVCVASVFLEKNYAQLRKFAALPEFQNLGIGSKLLRYVMGITKEAGVAVFWCNARVSARDFYYRFGLNAIGSSFHKNGIEYIKVSCQFSAQGD